MKARFVKQPIINRQSKRLYSLLVVFVIAFFAFLEIEWSTVTLGNRQRKTKLSSTTNIYVLNNNNNFAPPHRDEKDDLTSLLREGNIEESLLTTYVNDLQDENDNKKFDLDPTNATMKYFVYQPSGGWGNQRLILRWAMRAANAMDRTLIIPMISPHVMMWYGYDELNATSMSPAGRVLDLEALSLGLNYGVRQYVGHLRNLRKILPGAWKVWTKAQTKKIPDGRVVPAWMTENAIKFHWRRRTERVVFWNKGSMWMCCGGGEKMTPYIMFSKKMKWTAKAIVQSLFGVGVKYNAIHVRRALGHTRIDRRTAKHYIERHMIPDQLNTSLPLFIATDEKNKTWFGDILKMYKASYFWNNVVVDDSNPTQAAFRVKIIENLKADFPKTMQGDVLAFIEQLICANAYKWTGSDGSTFSMSIAGMRKYKTLTEVNWQKELQGNKKLAKLYNNQGEGDASEVESEVAEESVER